jgi:hypothetical protein
MKRLVVGLFLTAACAQQSPSPPVAAAPPPVAAAPPPVAAAPPPVAAAPPPPPLPPPPPSLASFNGRYAGTATLGASGANSAAARPLLVHGLDDADVD